MIEQYKLEDCKTIQRAFKIHNIDISLHKAYKLWSEYSENIYCASCEKGISMYDRYSSPITCEKFEQK